MAAALASARIEWGQGSVSGTASVSRRFRWLREVPVSKLDVVSAITGNLLDNVGQEHGAQ